MGQKGFHRGPPKAKGQRKSTAREEVMKGKTLEKVNSRLPGKKRKKTGTKKKQKTKKKKKYTGKEG